MKQRAEIKALAKECFKEQRGTGILLILLIAIIGGVSGGIARIPFLGPLIDLAVIFIVLPVLTVGLYGCYLKIYRKETVELKELFSKFQNDLARCLGGMLWMYLFIILWTLLFTIPGIIKGYAYRMTTFILAEYPNVKAKEALKISMKMTKGYKGKLFMLDLSFIGWAMLSMLTLGILAIVYVMPYYLTSVTGYYEEIKAQALESGAVTMEELTQESGAVAAETLA